MKAKTISISALFLCMSTTVLLAQSAQDTLKGEKKIDEVKIIGTTKKGTEANLIQVQKKSVEVIERVGAVQLSKQGVGDVATAVTKATGTVKQEGGNTIAVRGLLDRYNATTLNGLVMPSDDPENKNIDLSLLKTDVIDFISLEKVFNPRLMGDFGGANINVVSKEYSGKGYITFGMESGYNLQNSKTDKFLLQEGPNFFGTKVQKVPANPLSGYNYKTSWNFKDTFGPSMTMPINTGMNLQGGKSFKIGEQGRLNTFAFAGFSNDFSYREGSEGQFGGQQTMLKSFDKVQKYAYSTNTTGLLNLFYKINPNHQLKWITNYIHSTSQEARIYEGKLRDYAEDGGAYVRRADFKVTNVLVNQLGGDHKFGEKFSLNWIAAYNYLNSQRPDRITNTLVKNNDAENTYSATRETGFNNRYYDNLDDKEYTGNITLSYDLKDQSKIAVGYQGRFKKRTFFSKQMDFKWRNDISDPIKITDPNNVDAIFNSYNYAKGFFDISSNFGAASELVPILYNGDQDINSGFANVDYKFSDQLMVQLGARYDKVRQYVEWQINYKTYYQSAEYYNIEKNYNKFLPAVNIKYSVNDKQNLRLAASRTYTLPQLKEMAPYIYIDITETTQGNPFLRPSDNNNLDLKWEYFPKSGEVISVTGFGKYIQNPISKTFINSSDPYFSYLNAGAWAYVYGIEAELRKDIFSFGSGSKLYTFVNATYMDSKAELDKDKVAKENEIAVNFDVTEDKLQGATDFVANANIGLSHKFGQNNTMDFVVSYSYVGNYIYSISTSLLGNIEQKPINLLDFTARFNFNSKIDLGITLKNLLNPEMKRVQQNEINSVTYNYKRGQIIGMNVAYKF